MKYNNKKTVVDGIAFDSKREAARYEALKEMEKEGAIYDLRLQVPYTILPSMKDADGKTIRGIKYVADFVYRQNGEEIVEDCKGFRTDVYKMKKKLMLYKYGITIRES